MITQPHLTHSDAFDLANYRRIKVSKGDIMEAWEADMRRLSMILLVLFPALHAAEATWTQVGPGSGGGITGVYPHRSDPSIVFANADMVGLYRSGDGAATWEHCDFRDGTHMMYLAHAPEDPNTVFMAVHDGIWQSSDSGGNWELIGEASVVGYEIPTGANEAKSLMPMLATEEYLYVGIVNPPEDWGRISRMDRDTGEWVWVETGAQYAIREFIVHGDDLFAVSFDGIWRSPDEGMSWDETSSCNPPEAGLDCWWFNLAAYGDTLYSLAGLTADGQLFPYAQLYRSGDAGASWDSLRSFPGFAPQLGDIQANFHPPSKLMDASPMTGTLMVARVDSLANGFARSDTGGASWEFYNADNGFLGRVDSLGQPYHRISYRYLGKITMLRASPCSEDWYMSGAGYLAKSGNDGFEWAHEVEGLLNTVTFAVGEDPDDPDWILAGQGDNELRTSSDRGESWTNFSICADGPDSVDCWGGMVSSLAFDPSRSGEALALVAGGGNGYAGKGMGNRYLVRLWKDPFDYEIVHHFPDVEGEILPEGNRNMLALNASDPDELFLATFHKAADALGGSYETGVLRSVNGGVDWEAAELGLGVDGLGLPLGNMLIANLKADAHGNIYLSSGHSYGLGNALYRRNAVASRWDSLRALGGGERFLDGTLALGPDEGHILVSYAENNSSSITIQSTDGGDNWATVFSSDSTYTKCAAVAPWNPNMIYICQVGPDFRRPDASFSPWRSFDGGQTWQEDREGLILPNFHAMDIGPSGRIWAGSLGACVAWRELTPTDVDESGVAPILMTACAPNPFNPSTVFCFQLATAVEVDLSLHDVAGRRQRRLWKGPLEAGAHRLEWDGRDEEGRRLSSGVYFFRLKAGGQVRGEKVVMLK